MRRRQFLHLTALGATAALLTPAWLPAQTGTHGTEVVLLSCMDYRLLDDIERYMRRRKLTEKYDQLILAGASLGALTDKYPTWGATFWEHVDIAIKLHGVHTVMVMDHRDCGAYKVILGTEHLKTRATETAAHAGQLRALRQKINERHPQLKVETLLMALDGNVEAID